jgi:hypothetical protein
MPIQQRQVQCRHRIRQVKVACAFLFCDWSFRNLLVFGPTTDFDPTNTTLFIGGLSNGVTEEQLRAAFSRFGDIIYVKIPAGKGCGFVQFVLRTAAERAMATMNGQVMGASAMRISWGRSSSRVANQAQQQGAMAGPHFAGMHGVLLLTPCMSRR